MKYSIFLSFILLFIHNIKAKDLFMMSLEELLQVEVVVSSESSTNEFEAFSSVDKVREEEWTGFGAVTIFDTLKNLTGIDTHQSLAGTSMISIRGYTGSTSSARGKALLFDGIPLNGLSFGTNLYSKSFLPATLIESIELVKGPISSLHGPDAFHGAILLRPWTADTDTNQLISSVTDTGDNQLSLRSRYTISDKIAATSNIGYLYQRDANIHAENSNRHYKNEIESITFNQQFTYNKHKLGFLYNESETDDFYNVLSSLSESYADPAKSLLLYYKSEVELTEKISVSPSAWYNSSEFQLYFGEENQKSIEGWKDRQYGAKLHTSYKEKNFQLNIGVEFMHSWVQDAISHIAGDPQNTAAYNDFSKDVSTILLDYKQSLLNGDVLINIGGRYDYFSNTHVDEFSPQLGLSYFINKNNVLKAIYAQGYRAPAAAEMAGTTLIIGNDDLEGEVMDSYEFIHIYKSDSLKITNTLFINKWKDGIVEKDIISIYRTQRFSQFLNDGESEAWGYELEFSHHYKPLHSVYFLNGSYVSSTNNNTDLDYQMFPEYKIAYGVTYKNQKLSLTLQNLHKLNRKESDNTNADDIKDFFETTMGVRYKFERFTASFVINNLFDRENIEPSIWSVPDGIYQRGIHFQLGISSNF